MEEIITVPLPLEDGSVIDCTVVTIFTVEEKEYIALMLPGQKEENAEIMLYRYKILGEEEIQLEDIEEEEEWEKAVNKFDSLMVEE